MTDFPTVNAIQSTFGGGSFVVTDAFVAKKQRGWDGARLYAETTALRSA